MRNGRGRGAEIEASYLSEFRAHWRALLFLALVLVGLSYGTESDILGFLVRRFFALRVYSTVFSMLGAGITLASASGGLIQSLFLSATGKYWPFLMAASGSVLIGSALLLLLPRHGIDPAGQGDA